MCLRKYTAVKKMKKTDHLRCLRWENMHVAMEMIGKTLNYTAAMPFASSFAANVDPGEFEPMMQILRGEGERIIISIRAMRLYEVKSTLPQLTDWW